MMDQLNIETAPGKSRPPNAARAIVLSLMKAFGIDRAIAYTLLGRGWASLAGPLTIMLIGRFLRPDEQGFYYTFGSIVALNVFFELGLSFVIVQFASHEKASLEWTEDGRLIGSEAATRRLAAILRIAAKWYGLAAFLVVLTLLPAGLLFFSGSAARTTTVVWRGPWIWLTLAFSLNFFASPLFAIVEGCGRIADLARMRIGQNIVANIALWVTLLLHGGLFAASLFQTAMVGYGLFWIASSYWRLFLSLFRTDITDVRFSWREEVWPFQWRIAISWVSGYFMFQLFNPILFATHGAVVAGQMGMSLNLCSSLMGLSIAWMSTKASPFGVLVAKRRWKELDEQFFRTLGHSLLVLVSGLGVLYVVVLFLNRSANPYAQRVLPPTPFACLIVATAMNHVLFCEAQYLRAHKAEPFLYLSVAAGVFTCLSVYLLAKPFSAAGVSIGYLVSSGVTLCWGTLILRRLRRVWHVESADEAICPA